MLLACIIYSIPLIFIWQYSCTSCVDPVVTTITAYSMMVLCNCLGTNTTWISNWSWIRMHISTEEYCDDQHLLQLELAISG